nr:uncharacterized protein LOC125968877 [Syngnathus scovelli]
MYMDNDNHLVAPLPFRDQRPLLPNNREQALKRLNVLKRALDKKTAMREQFIEFMQRIFDNDQAEKAPELTPGPDLNNTLLGVLLRFRKEQVAVTVDVEQMFYCFRVKESHRNYLRFLWFKDNDPNEAITEFRMKVPVFGNSPSPAIAIYGLRRAAELGEEEHGSKTKAFVFRNFYVDEEDARRMLAEANIRLHKIASNVGRVMNAFPPEERATDLKDLDLDVDPPPLQRSLGVCWDLERDCFTFRVAKDTKPFTRRGILSVVNSLYDPLGFAAPVTIQGKALYRELTLEQQDWDDPLPSDKEAEWLKWTESLSVLESLQIQRPFFSITLSETQTRELCIFSDASMMAIAAVAYLKVSDRGGHYQVGFVMGKSKLAPSSAHTVPRLELCAAVLAVELAQIIVGECDIEFDAVKFYTDSRIVLGCIHNSTRRFYVYVTNRVAQIRKSTKPEQWVYVATDQNPADHGTRVVQASHLQNTTWLTGPQFLVQSETEQTETSALVNPSEDGEIRPQVTALITKVSKNKLGSHRFERFSTWKSLVQGMRTLLQVAMSRSKASQSDVIKPSHPKVVILKCVQQEIYQEEIELLSKGKDLPSNSPIGKLDPFVDEDGLLRVGGRLQSADLSEVEKHPVIIPNSHHVAVLLVRHYHNEVAHQGRQFTEGSLRTAGLWIVGAKRLISTIIHKCVLCRKLRGHFEEQKMASLPSDRLTVDPPFTHVGLDVFGPWSVTSRRTRASSVENKRWAVMFTCLCTRAVHIEVVESMSTSSFINALRRFLSIRGPVRNLRSDQGTNFIGACNELQINVDDPQIKDYLQEQSCTWTFNAPHSSHMGGVWERMIGLARNILDGLLSKGPTTRLTHEVLVTLMAEVVAIMNARPLVPVSTDRGAPEVLSPGMLLTQKANPVLAPPGNFELRDLYKAQWHQVQGLADCFWKRWKREYLATLQARRKWKVEKPNVKEGDIVLLKDNQAKRNEWPLGTVVKAIPSHDSRVRKVEVKIVQHGSVKTYTRPITDVILLCAES